MNGIKEIGLVRKLITNLSLMLLTVSLGVLSVSAEDGDDSSAAGIAVIAIFAFILRLNM